MILSGGRVGMFGEKERVVWRRAQSRYYERRSKEGRLGIGFGERCQNITFV